MKESVTKFDLEAAFKALDELDIPVAKKGIAANRVNLKETFNKKLKTEALIEDYYDVNNSDDLNKASEDRQAEVAQAKLARIEKIVDLDAETEEDILPSYEGKVIVQCPQCMTLFYKNPEDVEASEEDDTIVNIGEVCQHCGNESGYTVIGKVAAVEPEVEETEEETDDLNLDFEEPVDEEEAGEEETATTEEDTTSEVSEAEESGEETGEDDLIPMTDGNDEEEKKEESFENISTTTLVEAVDDDKEANTDVDIDEIDLEDDTDEVEEVKADEGNEVEETEGENKEALEVLKDKIDVHGEGDTVVIAEKGQLDNEEAPKVEVEVSEEEFDTLEKEFHEEAVEEKSKDTEDTVEEDQVENEDEEKEDKEVSEEETETEVTESLIEELADIKWKGKLDKHFTKGYRVIGWAKAVKDEESGEFYDRREIAKDAPAASFSDAIESAKTFAKQSSNGIADIYGIEDDNKQKLLRTFDTKAKETTNFVTGEVKDKDGKVINKGVAATDYFDYKKELGKAPTTGAEAAEDEPENPGLIQRMKDKKAEKAEVKANNKALNKDEIDADWEKAGGVWMVDSSDEIFTNVLNKGINSFISLKDAIDYAQKLSSAFKGVVISASKADTPEDPVENGENLIEFDGGKMTKNSKLTTFAAQIKTQTESLENNSTSALNEDSNAFKELMGSKEFKTPISDAEVRSYFEDINTDVISVDDALADIEDIDEASIAKCITESLTNVYENINTFDITDCELNKNTLVIEGLIEFKSGNTKAIKYAFNEAHKVNNKLTFKGLNETLDKNGLFTITCSINNQSKNLITEELHYEYSIDNAPIQGSVSLN